MEQLVSDFGGVVDQLNPLSRQNQIVYLVWLVSYVFLLGAVWRCGRRWLRLVFLILVQLLSVGLFVSQANIVILAIYLWRESLALAAVAMLVSLWTFRERRRSKGAGSAGRVQDAGAERAVLATVAAPTPVSPSCGEAATSRALP